MKINIENATKESIKEQDRINPAEISKMRETIRSIQAQFKEKSTDYEGLVADLRAWTKSHEQKDDIERVILVAKDIRDNFKAKAFVTIGIGGSDLGSRTLHACLNHSQHNLLSEQDRGGAPEIYFTGDTFDPYELHDILEVLEKRGLLLKTIYNVISKSGTTSETIAAFMAVKERLENALVAEGRSKEEYAQYIVATTGLNSKSALFTLNESQPVKFRALLPVPDGVGGRFSFASPVGLLFLAVSANQNSQSVEERIASAVEGLQDAEVTTYLDPDNDENIAANLALMNVLAEQRKKGTLVFYPYSKTLKLIGEWFTQLSTESLQEKGQGQNVVSTCGPTGNHSLLNGIIGGPRDKAVIFIRVEKYDEAKDFIIGPCGSLGGGLDVLEGKSFGFIQNASQLGTEINFTNSGVLNVTISIPQISTYTICKLMYILESSVAFEGELRGLGRLTYEQAGVEGYKVETKKVLSSAN